MVPNKVSRRIFVKTAAVGTIASLTGCAGQSDDGSDQTQTENTQSNKNDGSSENVVYAFSPNQATLIDPQNAEVIGEITDGVNDAGWGDALSSPDNRQLFVNDGTNAQVVVIDTERQQIETRLDVGPGVTHMYQPSENELWTHSDEEGSFYIIDMTELAVTDKVVAAQEDTAHGKLAYHEQLGTTGYATNTNDPGIHVVDLETKETTDFIETHDEGGTHAKRYNPVSGHLYIEGTMDSRTAVVDTEENTVVDHFDVIGHIYNTPNDAYVVWVNEEQGVNVLDPKQDEFVAEIPVEGGPDKMFFHEEDAVYGFTANTQNSTAAVVDFDQLEIVDTVEVGDIHRPEDAQRLHRGGLAANDWFVTPASGENVVSIVDAPARKLHAKVDVTENTDTVAYVSSFE